MKWQLGSRECDREKNIFVHLTWEINSPNKWHDYISWLYFLNFKKFQEIKGPHISKIMQFSVLYWLCFVGIYQQGIKKDNLFCILRVCVSA